MRRPTFLVLAILGCAARATADPAPIAYNLRYEAFSLGFAIMQMDVSVRIFPRTYDVTLSYHTVGLAHLLYPGQQDDHVSGTWEGDRAIPQRYSGTGEWHGRQRRIDIVYRDEQPDVLQLFPPVTDERQAVAPTLQRDTKDTLSALAQLLHRVDRDDSCDTSARVFDGRRLSEIDASTAGVQKLAQGSGARFAGTALRCNFIGRMLAGFLLDRSRAGPGRPRVGSAWFASLQPGEPALPVRVQFGTDWFGNVTMVLTGATPEVPDWAQAASLPR
jgi:hypothetical protein